MRSRNSRLFPELNPHRSAGNAFCLGARSSRDLVSNNAMPGPSSPFSTTSTLFLYETYPFSRRRRSIFEQSRELYTLSLVPRRYENFGLWRVFDEGEFDVTTSSMTQGFPAVVIMPKLRRIFEEISIKIRRPKIGRISVFYMGATF